LERLLNKVSSVLMHVLHKSIIQPPRVHDGIIDAIYQIRHLSIPCLLECIPSTQMILAKRLTSSKLQQSSSSLIQLVFEAIHVSLYTLPVETVKDAPLNFEIAEAAVVHGTTTGCFPALLALLKDSRVCNHVVDLIQGLSLALNDPLECCKLGVDSNSTSESQPLPMDIDSRGDTSARTPSRIKSNAATTRGSSMKKSRKRPSPKIHSNPLQLERSPKRLKLDTVEAGGNMATPSPGDPSSATDGAASDASDKDTSRQNVSLSEVLSKSVAEAANEATKILLMPDDKTLANMIEAGGKNGMLALLTSVFQILTSAVGSIKPSAGTLDSGVLNALNRIAAALQKVVLSLDKEIDEAKRTDLSEEVLCLAGRLGMVGLAAHVGLGESSTLDSMKNVCTCLDSISKMCWKAWNRRGSQGAEKSIQGTERKGGHCFCAGCRRLPIFCGLLEETAAPCTSSLLVGPEVSRLESMSKNLSRAFTNRVSLRLLSQMGTNSG
jgi:hypothetical protein